MKYLYAHLLVKMLQEDEKYLQEILALFQVQMYKVSETPSRFKLIIHPKTFTMKILDDVQTLKSRPVGIEVDVKNGVFIECLKEGSSRKRRRIFFEKFSGKVPPKYKVGKFQDAMMHILGIPDMCEFDLECTDKKLELVGIQCISYPILKKIEDTGCEISFNMRDSSMILTL